MEALKDDKVNMIGVWGMGGVGKTTLVIEVGKKTKELRCFHKVNEFVVSQTSIIENIQHKIADFLNLKFEKTTKEGKAEELWLRLKKEEKVLIILDDMWNEVQLNEIGLPLNENGNGCKIILTTRRMTGCESMECQVIVPVDVLDNDEAWTLFRMKAYLDERVSRDIIETAKEVAKECKGLPVAIVTLAKALKGTKTVKGWEVARKKLERSRLMEVGNIEEEGEEKNAYLCIKMSYEYLKKETTKRCFLLCALYPEDHSIDVKHLVRYAWGLELFGKADSIEEVRIQVLEAIDYLKDSCLLLKDEDVERYVKLHDIVRDVALWIASKEESDFLIKSRLEEHKIFPEKLVHPNVEILLLNDCDIQGTCFQGMKELKVLSLTSFSSCVISLYALTSLRKLRVLHLAFFEDLSYLGKLTTLEILSLRTTEFEDFPHPNVIRRLSKLEELYLKGSSIGEESDDILLEIKFLTRLTALSLSLSSSHFIEDFEFPRLEEYNIFLRGTQDKLGCPHPEQWGKFLEEAARKISYEIQGLNSVVNLTKRSLKIEGVFPYNVVSQLLENLESLQVFDIKDEYIEGLTDQTQQIVSVSVILQNLKQVRIENCMNLEVVFQTEKVEGNEAPPLLSNLKSLRLKRLIDLSCIWELPTQHVRLESLVDLRIEDCPSLKSLFSVSLAQGLVLLEKLKIIGCGELKQIVTKLEGDEKVLGMGPTMVPLSKLQSLELENLPDLRWLFKGSPHSFIFQSLKVVNIGGCGELKSLFSPSLIQSLVLLEKLQIRSCDELKTLLAEPENDDEMESKSSSLPLCLPNLKTLYIHHCSKLEYVVPITLAQGLPSLESVSISQCYELKQVFGMSKEQDGVQHDGLLLLASLQHLNLEWLLKLTSFVPQNYTVKAPALKRFYVYDCPQLMNSPIQHVHKKLELRLESVGLAAFKELFGNTINLLVHRVWDDKILIPDLENLEHHSQAMMGFKYNGEPSEGCFPNLKSLRVKNCVNLLKVFEIAEGLYNQEENQAPQILSKLEYLELYYLLDLRQIVKGPTRYVNLQSLKVLDIIRCSEPKSLFPLSVSQTLSSLEELNIHECGELVNVFMELEEEEKEEEDDDEEDDDDDDDDDDVDGVIESDALCLPNLKTVEITQCPRLKYVFPLALARGFPRLQKLQLVGLSRLRAFLQGGDFIPNPKKMELFNLIWLRDNLRELIVHYNNNLTYIFPVMLIQHLSQLSILEIKSCEKLKGIIGNDDILASSSQGPRLEMKMVFPQLKQIVLEDLPKLESFSPIRMNDGENSVSIELQESAEPVPQLLKLISSNKVAGFNCIIVSYLF
ncbi:hypothetical protein V6Z12_A01G046900 [Gossypium hirsutum]